MRIDAVSPAAPDSSAPPSPDQSPALLPEQLFASIVAHAPLVAIDLIVEDGAQSVLLGLRTNPPARGWWFVPGGRVRKGETLDDAFCRLSHEELGLQAIRSAARLIGVYEHFYDTDFRGMPSTSTHYIVLAYRLRVTQSGLHPPQRQHSQYQWLPAQRIAQEPYVHPYTKAYFETAKS